MDLEPREDRQGALTLTALPVDEGVGEEGVGLRARVDGVAEALGERAVAAQEVLERVELPEAPQER